MEYLPFLIWPFVASLILTGIHAYLGKYARGNATATRSMSLRSSAPHAVRGKRTCTASGLSIAGAGRAGSRAELPRPHRHEAAGAPRRPRLRGAAARSDAASWRA